MTTEPPDFPLDKLDPPVIRTDPVSTDGPVLINKDPEKEPDSDLMETEPALESRLDPLVNISDPGVLSIWLLPGNIPTDSKLSPPCMLISPPAEIPLAELPPYK